MTLSGPQSERMLRRQVAALYPGTLWARLYTVLKFSLIPFEQFSRHIPRQGRILDLGCGYGYLANYLSLEAPQRLVLGIDVDTGRVRAAQQTIGQRSNIQFLLSDSRQLPSEATFDGAVIADVLHHVPYTEQQPILADLYDRLTPGGVLVMRETDQQRRVRYFLFNWLLEWVLYAGKEKLRFRSAGEWREMLEQVGYTVQQVIPQPAWSAYITATVVCVKPE